MLNRKMRDKVDGRRVMQMPLKPEAKERKYDYDQRYLKQNMTVVNVTFNRRKPEDMILLDWVTSRDEARVAYIKRLIREDMEKFL